MELVTISCRCKDCDYSEPRHPHKVGLEELLYCCYWDYQRGMSPNCVDADDFCSNGVKV